MIIIGNGSSILDQPLGSQIDEFQEVVRFNDYVLRPEWTGEKTTHWWNTVNYQNLHHDNLTKEYQEICLHSWQFHPEQCKVWKKLSSICRAQNIFKSREDWVFEIQQFAETKHYGFSTGLLAIWFYLKTRPSITIYGFDWWDRDKHHAFDNAPRGTLHNPKLEKKIIDKLAAQNKIYYL